MCRLSSCFCGTVSLKKGALMIGWSLFLLSAAAIVSEFLHPWVHTTYNTDYSPAASRLFIIWNIIDMISNLVLLSGIYGKRARYFIMWLCVCLLNIAMLVWDLQVQIRYGKADNIVGRIVSTALVVEFWLYMYIIIYNYYLDLEGYSRYASLMNLIGRTQSM